MERQLIQTRGLLFIIALFILTLLTTLYKQNRELKRQILVHYQKVSGLEPSSHIRTSAYPLIQNKVEKPFDWLKRVMKKKELNNLNSVKLSKVHQEDMLGRDPFIVELESAYEVRLDLTGIFLDEVEYKLGDGEITILGKFSEMLEGDIKEKANKNTPPTPFYKIVALPADADSFNVRIDQQGTELVATMPKK